ncbi:MAG TPA: thiamine phosphate synthase [Candidatus Sulfotelmatobacter sp.]|nr:thiamine phosphate synthase [Candidatus Sulfotelmatobacter sp.]
MSARIEPTRLRVHALVTDWPTAAQAAHDGATVIQLRLKGATTEQRVSTGRRLLELRTVVIVNDDVEAALAIGAHGVHLGEEDAGAERAVREGLVVGLSAGTADAARKAAANGASYVGAGPVWPTRSKLDAGPAIGLEGLGTIAAAVSIPVVAIGGVDQHNAGDCIAAGASGVAILSAVARTRAIRHAVDLAIARRPATPRALTTY